MLCIRYPSLLLSPYVLERTAMSLLTLTACAAPASPWQQSCGNQNAFITIACALISERSTRCVIILTHCDGLDLAGYGGPSLSNVALSDIATCRSAIVAEVFVWLTFD